MRRFSPTQTPRCHLEYLRQDLGTDYGNLRPRALRRSAAHHHDESPGMCNGKSRRTGAMGRHHQVDDPKRRGFVGCADWQGQLGGPAFQHAGQQSGTVNVSFQSSGRRHLLTGSAARDGQRPNYGTVRGSLEGKSCRADQPLGRALSSGP